jgi:DNA invertase Pin-like site-specific DNA recombinase
MAEKVGYARVSSKDQSLARQLDALNADGCVKIFEEKKSGKRGTPRAVLDEALGYLREGDTLVVTELARLGRSVRHLIELLVTFGARGIHLRSLNGAIDTTTAMGRLIFHIAAAFAEFERDVIAERAEEGRAAAKARGETGGRPSADRKKIDAARILVAGGMSQKQAAGQVGIGRATLTRYGVGTVAAGDNALGEEVAA